MKIRNIVNVGRGGCYSHPGDQLLLRSYGTHRTGDRVRVWGYIPVHSISCNGKKATVRTFSAANVIGVDLDGVGFALVYVQQTRKLKKKRKKSVVDRSIARVKNALKQKGKSKLAINGDDI